MSKPTVQSTYSSAGLGTASPQLDGQPSFRTTEASAGLEQPGTQPVTRSDRLISKAPAPITPLKGSYSGPSRQPAPANWNKWKFIPKCSVWEAVCLTFDIEPEDEKSGIRRWLESRRGVPYGLPDDFADRLQVVLANVSTDGPIHPPMYVGSMNNPHAEILLSEVATAAIAWGWTIPNALRALVAKAAPPAQDVMREAALIEVPHKSPRDFKPWETLPQAFNVIDGVYMYQQTAREIADAEGWDDAKLEALEAEMVIAMKDGSLPIRSHKTGMVIAPNATHSLSLVTVEDVNKWLEKKRVPYRWKLQGKAAHPQATAELTTVEDEQNVGWFDATLDAATWWSLNSISPDEAARLLCQFNPHDEKSDPFITTNDQTGPDDFKRVRRVFEDLAITAPIARSLSTWLDIAKTRGLKYHSWIDRYAASIRAKESLAPESTSIQPQAMGVNDVPAKRQQPKDWRDVAWDYVVQIYAAGQFATAKTLYQALEKRSETGDSPFDKGVGQNAHSLFVRDISQPLSLKTLQNAWPEIKSARQAK